MKMPAENRLWLELIAESLERNEELTLSNLCLELIASPKDEKIFQKIQAHWNETNDSRCLPILGLCYENGFGTAIDRKKAFSLAEQGANLGEPFSQMRLGFYYKNGWECKKNFDKTVELFKAAFNQTKVYEIYTLARSIYFESDRNFFIFDFKDIKKGVELIQKAADNNCSYAMVALSSLYSGGGYNIPVNVEKARQYLEAVIFKGDRYRIAYALAHVVKSNFYYGQFEGIPPDGVEIERLLKIAADYGSEIAQLRLGLTSEKNEDMEFRFRLKAALHYYYLCAEQDGDYGMKKITKLAAKISEMKGKESKETEDKKAVEDYEYLQKEIQTIFENFKKDAKLKDKVAMHNLAICYIKGIGTEVNVEKGFELLNKAAKLDNERSLGELGERYRTGDGVSSSLSTALSYYKKATIENDAWDDVVFEIEDTLDPIQAEIQRTFNALKVEGANVISAIIAEYAYDVTTRRHAGVNEIQGFFMAYRPEKQFVSMNNSPKLLEAPLLQTESKSELEYVSESESGSESERLEILSKISKIIAEYAICDSLEYPDIDSDDEKEEENNEDDDLNGPAP